MCENNFFKCLLMTVNVDGIWYVEPGAGGVDVGAGENASHSGRGEIRSGAVREGRVRSRTAVISRALLPVVSGQYTPELCWWNIELCWVRSHITDTAPHHTLLLPHDESTLSQMMLRLVFSVLGDNTVWPGVTRVGTPQTDWGPQHYKTHCFPSQLHFSSQLCYYDKQSCFDHHLLPSQKYFHSLMLPYQLLVQIMRNWKLSQVQAIDKLCCTSWKYQFLCCWLVACFWYFSTLNIYTSTIYHPWTKETVKLYFFKYFLKLPK